MARQACPTCPWRTSTPPGGFPGGCIQQDELRRMSSGDPSCMKVMQCHNTPDDHRAKVCVGFAVRVGGNSVGYRLAGALGLLDPVADDGDELLPSVEAVIERHNTGRGLVCR